MNNECKMHIIEKKYIKNACYIHYSNVLNLCVSILYLKMGKIGKYSSLKHVLDRENPEIRARANTFRVTGGSGHFGSSVLLRNRAA